jgi:VWFA-related protein
MSGVKSKNLVVVVGSVVCLVFNPGLTVGQSQTQDQADVIKVFTELVQTDVMVLDKKGHFVDGLKREDFEIKIDGKVRELQSADRVVAGTGREQTLLTTDNAGAAPASTDLAGDVSERKQTVLFYIDDYHMDLPGITATRKAINDFIDRDMDYNTEAGIGTATSQIGFLQQVTDDKVVLRAALRRLYERFLPVDDPAPPKIRDTDALLIDRGDGDLNEYFVRATMAQNPALTRDGAQAIVSERVQGVLSQAATITKRTLAGLEQMIATASKSPGRKILFFFSNGFFLDHHNSDASERTQSIISNAAHNGVVVYSIDARGLIASLTDASTPSVSDPRQNLERASRQAISIALEIMSLLAKDTGGKLIANTNDLTGGMQRSLDESSAYYLLAWKPEAGTPEPNKFRKISVSVIDRPDLTVRVRRGFYTTNPPAALASTNDKKPAETAPADPVLAAMQKALVEPFPKRDLPLSVTLNYLSTPDKGITLSTSIQFSRNSVSFVADASGKANGGLRIVGAAYDDKGRPGAKLNDLLTLQTNAKENDEASSDTIVSTYTLRLGPGLYQVRVAARDQNSGRIGTTNAWIEIPDLSAPKLALSSLIVGGGQQTKLLTPTSQRNVVDQMGLNVDRRYLQNSVMRMLVFAYNAKLANDTARPNVNIKVEIIHNHQAVVSSPIRKISTDGIADLKRLPYAADISLAGLGRGHYELKVTAVDELTKNTAAQEWRFEIE